MKKTYDRNELKAIRDSWKIIPIEAIPEKHREDYNKRKFAIDLYIEGISVNEIEKTTGIRRNTLYRNLEKCLERNTEGKYFGYQAIIPYSLFIGDRKNNSSHNARSEFNILMEKFPELKEFVMGNYYGIKKYTLEKNMNYRSVHKKFLVKCKELGIHEYEYPFNTKNLGYVSLINFINQEAINDIANAVNRENKDTKQKIKSTGHGKKYSVDPVAPYQRVQVDGHIIDLGYNVQVDKGDGTIDKVMATRAWLFVVIDVATRCVLGYSASQEFNYNQYDVIRAIRDSIEPRKKMTFTIEGFEYPENGGYPSMAFAEAEYAVFNEIMLDNAKSHLAKNVVNKVVDTLKCAMNFGSVATPETRGIVERFFGSLETRGFHKLPSTTGSNIKDLKRNNPEEKCVRYDITYDEILELLEVLIADYNNESHPALHGETPMQAMERKLKKTCLLPATIEESRRKEVQKLTHYSKIVRVRGGMKQGKRPYIQFENACYRNDALTAGDGYVGKDITIIVDPDDVSQLEAYAPDGTSLGILTAMGEYGRKSHSLRTRKAAAKLMRQNQRQNLRFTTPLSDYEEHLREEAQKSRRAATKADIVRREQGKPVIEEQLQQEHEIIDMKSYKRKDNTESESEALTIPEFIAKFKKEHNGQMPGPVDYLELSKKQKSV